MSGQPSTSDIGNHEFLLTITDGEIDVQEEININVRQNNAPVFLNESSIPSLIRVGCYDNNQTIGDEMFVFLTIAEYVCHDIS